jgi:purine-binding chemotaxis protein CheW
MAFFPLPQAPHAVAGVSDYRGVVIPVVDLRVRFGLPSAPPNSKTKWIVLDVGGRPLALVVDAVTEVFGTGGAQLRPAPSLARGDDSRALAGVADKRSALVFVLDVQRFAGLVALVPPRALDAPPGQSRDEKGDRAP